MRRLNLGLILHNHQPVGQLPWVFETIYNESYLPLLEALEANPHVRLSLHYSGCLLDWIVVNRPDFAPRVRVLVERGQVEILTGGYYEPILVSIPESDAVGQIAKLTDRIKELFGAEASGGWLAERVWEPHLPGILARAGVSWTVLDDTHFKIAGLEEGRLRGYFMTEDRGQPLKVVATSKHLRATIPWHDVEEVIAYLQSQASEEPTLIVMGDDGEKFGSWPGTYDHVWTKGWMSRFLEALAANSEWLSTVPVGEYIASHASLGRVYMPAASYEEMMEWALPAQRSYELSRLRKRLAAEPGGAEITQFLTGGLWRNFMARYSEVNTLHKKALRVHHKLARVEAQMARGSRLRGTFEQLEGRESATSLPREMPAIVPARPAADSALAPAWDHLWAAECNCPYWHGVFGGIYLRDIRHALFKEAIEAEKLADARLHKASWLEVEQVDHDLDGADELLVESESSDVYLAPARGGAIFEWDLKDPALNLATAMTRRPEAYHETLREALAHPPDQAPDHVESIHDAVVILDHDIGDALLYDWHDRICLVEHFLANETGIDEFYRGAYGDLGDFALQPFSGARDGERGVALEREGSVRQEAGEARLRLRKLLDLGTDGSLAVSYILTHLDGPDLDCRFGSEWNLSPLLTGSGYQTSCTIDGKERGPIDAGPESEPQVREMDLASAVLGLHLSAALTPAASLWRLPIEAATASERGFERTYQGHCFYFHWPLKLGEGKTARFGLRWTPREIVSEPMER